MDHDHGSDEIEPKSMARVVSKINIRLPPCPLGIWDEDMTAIRGRPPPAWTRFRDGEPKSKNSGGRREFRAGDGFGWGDR